MLRLFGPTQLGPSSQLALLMPPASTLSRVQHGLAWTGLTCSALACPVAYPSLQEQGFLSAVEVEAHLHSLALASQHQLYLDASAVPPLLNYVDCVARFPAGPVQLQALLGPCHLGREFHALSGSTR